jgi:uncharacterized protein
MNRQEQLKEVERYVREELGGESSGHDWHHVDRVRNVALAIAREEGANLYKVEITALLHDIGDPKLYNGDTTVAPRLIGAKLDEMGVVDPDKSEIMYIIGNMSYSKSLEGEESEKSLEFKCVQDADRLDAIGAIGIARCFAYGGSKGRIIHDSGFSPRSNMTVEEYHNSAGTGVSHFYEKLLLLKDKMNTEAGKRLAEGRHILMENFLENLYKECDGKA